MRRETLRFNLDNPTTVVVERVHDDAGGTRVRKELRRAGTTPPAVAHWSASTDPRRWNYWHREAEVYGDPGLRASLAGTGLSLPAAEVVEHADGTTLWLEDVPGVLGVDFTLADHVALAAALGRWQAGGPHDAPWASRGFLRDYSTSRPGDVGLVDDDAAWEHPLVRDTWPAGLREGWARLLAHREDLLGVVEGQPRTLCHLDAWVSNVIRRPDGELCLLDWTFAGDGAVGEDLGNYLPDAVLDLFWPAERLPELEAACFAAHLDGLRRAGWSGSERDVRLGMVASCVKYAWLLPLVLGRAGDGDHHAYHRSADAERLYRQRGLVFAHLVGWCDEALRLVG
ncbi:aminoglycoside phosphotransferase family protein [Kineococcus rubinsiae]|uniref:aminoglycoside phosphotransferase family protein n=1 Tax=Kineococcus rubinsiae TaxID=2609562 RepID=UPI00142F5BB8|nr:aminoglycoside phosphotransferase family protein [Kineococcus rubinsiae]NIZ93263.1 aminoglycoside phosphotransferase family protein [Kineococcus rubinsiae]